MFYVYVLRSKRDYRLYVGYTSDLIKKLKEHNSGQNKSTKHRIPLELIYYEAYKSKSDAEKREKMLKQYKRTMGGLKRRIKLSLES